MTGIASLGSGEATSGAIATMDPWAQLLWGMLIFVGSMDVLLGMFWQGDARTGLILKRLGFIMLVVPCVIFGIAVVASAGSGGITVALSLWGFAVACHLRARTVHKHIKAIIRLSEASNGQ
jgi:hypothetical protein